MAIATARSVLNQLSDLVSQLERYEYTQKLEVLNGSSIGQHVRHTVEFFQCLIEGCKEGSVDYDARKRNLRIETDLYYTLQLVEELQQQIEGYEDLYSPVRLCINYCVGDDSFVETNFMRELVYLIEHSIHHFALIRIGVQENFKHVAIEPNFGVAYSTIRYQHDAMAVERG